MLQSTLSGVSGEGLRQVLETPRPQALKVTDSYYYTHRASSIFAMHIFRREKMWSGCAQVYRQ